jgi:RNA polymerase sigma-54 factor
MLHQVQQQKMIQKLSPQQIQLVKLLEVTTQELSERILQEIDQNPALELGESFDQEETEETKLEETESENRQEEFNAVDFDPEDDTPDYLTELPVEASKERQKERLPVSSDASLNDYLLEQLDLQDLHERDRHIAEFIIGDIDEDGYLRRDLSSLVEDLAILEGIETTDTEIGRLLQLVQQFDPPGVGACDLKECLLLQLRRKRQTPVIANAIQLIENYFEPFSKKHYEVILKKMGISMEELKQVIDEVVKLNPKPGRLFGSTFEDTMEQILPDFIVENMDGVLHLSLNNSFIPELRINREYLDMVKDYQANSKNRTREAREAIQFAREKVEAARWFIDAVKQRQETLTRVMQAIIDYQYDYFLDGDERKLKPMILKDIAERTGYDISTISRVSNSKYVQTDFGIFPVKHFFTEAMQTDRGEEVSTLEIKNILKQLIEQEDKNHPLTDEELSDRLNKHGYMVARRTIAKYRDQLGLPVARLRRNI